MNPVAVSEVPMSLGSNCYRLTHRGRACVDLVEAEAQTIGSLSKYLHDVLMMCESGVWLDQLRQSMPPRSLERSLRSLLALGLIERLAPKEPPAQFPFRASPWRAEPAG